jgi:hypothetical protein
MTLFEEIEIIVIRPVIDISTFGGPRESILGEPRTRGVATGDLQQLAAWYMMETPVELSELDPRLSGRAFFTEQPHAVGPLEHCDGSGQKLFPPLSTLEMAQEAERLEEEIRRAGRFTCPACRAVFQWRERTTRVPSHERRSRPGTSQRVLGRGEFVVNGVALIEGGEASEGRTVLTPGRILHIP